MVGCCLSEYKTNSKLLYDVVHHWLVIFNVKKKNEKTSLSCSCVVNTSKKQKDLLIVYIRPEKLSHKWTIEVLIKDSEGLVGTLSGSEGLKDRNRRGGKICRDSSGEGWRIFWEKLELWVSNLARVLSVRRKGENEWNWEDHQLGMDGALPKYKEGNVKECLQEPLADGNSVRT